MRPAFFATIAAALGGMLFLRWELPLVAVVFAWLFGFIGGFLDADHIKSVAKGERGNGTKGRGRKA